jgi:hypothetical protein
VGTGEEEVGRLDATMDVRDVHVPPFSSRVPGLRTPLHLLVPAFQLQPFLRRFQRNDRIDSSRAARGEVAARHGDD